MNRIFTAVITCLLLFMSASTQARFTQADTWVGDKTQPITLHKYLYANGDPANFIDPTGQFGLTETAVTTNIASILTSLQVDNSFDVFNLAGVGDDPRIQTAKTANRILGLLNLGTAGVQVLRMLSKKFRSCKNNCGFQTKLVVGGGRAKNYPAHGEGTITLNTQIGAKPTVGGRGQNAPFKDSVFKEVLIENLPYHQLDVDMFYEMRRILGPGGKLTGTTGAGANLNDIKSALHQAGFQNVNVRYGLGNGPIEFFAELP